jgi:hypothetical protein
MTRTHLVAIAISLVAVASFATGAFGEQRKPGRPIGTTEQRMLICDKNNIDCSTGCDKLIDIDNNISNCRTQCDDRYRRCQKWAKVPR